MDEGNKQRLEGQTLLWGKRNRRAYCYDRLVFLRRSSFEMKKKVRDTLEYMLQGKNVVHEIRSCSNCVEYVQVKTALRFFLLT